MALNLPQLRAFLAVVDEGGFGTAAEALGVTQSAVSHAVAALERTLGHPVLLRRGTPRPTAFGAEVVARIGPIWGFGKGIELRNMETDEPLSTVLDQVQAANVYVGGRPMVEALRQGAQVGRALVEQAVSHLGGYGGEADLLRAIARFAIERDR